jgi:hypothetical protein
MERIFEPKIGHVAYLWSYRIISEDKSFDYLVDMLQDEDPYYLGSFRLSTFTSAFPEYAYPMESMHKSDEHEKLGEWIQSIPGGTGRMVKGLVEEFGINSMVKDLLGYYDGETILINLKGQKYFLVRYE